MKTETKAGQNGSISRLIVLALATVMLCAGAATGSAAAAELDLVVKKSNQPEIELVRAKKSFRFSMGNLHYDPLVSVAGRPLEVWAHRLNAGEPAVVDLIDRTSGNPVATRAPGLAAALDRGLSGFLRIRIRTAAGKLVYEGHDAFCPRGSGIYQAETSARGSSVRPRRSAVPVFPGAGYAEVCGEEQAESLVWMISRRDPAYYFGSKAHRLADGRYTYELVVNPDGLLPEKTLENNRFVQKFSLTSDRRLWRDLLGGGGTNSSAGTGVRAVDRQALSHRKPKPVKPPTLEQIGGLAGALPDPAALPASRFGFERTGGRDRISFSSIVANLGDAPIALFGSRSGTEGTSMPGWQYLKGADGGLLRRPTNGFVWDQRDTHRHWHYNRLAVYELLSGDGKVLRRSGKIGFCFMPTTALRFEPVPGAIGEGTPFGFESGGLPINCGSRKSKRVAMALQAGWGDEYYQGVAGQSIDVTDLAAGSYRLRITVNGEGDLAESDPLNNVSERVIELAGTGRKRTLNVPRQGIVSPEFYKLASYGRGGSRRAASVSSWGQTAAAPRLLCGLAPPA